ncbi:MAG: hypothetical protein GY938_15100 [Ketobacter sp.]|nr:hypothetical protein [Ketobacter sp.]
MDINKPYIRGLLFYDFKFELNATDSSRRINDALNKDTVSEPTVRDWFSRFRPSDFNL